MFSFNSKVRFSETNASSQLSYSSIINYFQDCSSFHSEALGVGLDFVKEKNRAWILSSWQLEVNRFPQFNETITIGTWPTSFQGMLGNRNYILLSEQKEVLAVAHSIWVYLDTTTLRPTRILPEDSMPYLSAIEAPYPMTLENRKIIIPNTLTEQTPFPVTALHLDTNQHVNNGQYIAMAESYLPKTFVSNRMRADYRKSAVLGNAIYPYVHTEETTCTIVLADDKKSPYAIIQFKQPQ